MTIDELLAMSDPAHHLPAEATGAASPLAEAMLTRISTDIAPERSVAYRPSHPRALRRTIVIGVLAGAAATILVAGPMPGDHDGSGLVASAYAVTRGGGAVRVTVHWSELADPDALQAALDEAGARVKIFVSTASRSPCLGPPNTVGYSSKAVQWRVNGPLVTKPGGADSSGFIVRPGYFPENGTFVVAVVIAPARTGEHSSGAPRRPQVESISSYMVVGPVLPNCAP